ncbi:hypothetical protein HED49_19995 [Ochrobactrum daejeonense]|nr:hypothetical protein [Brucella daejeonensis]
MIEGWAKEGAEQSNALAATPDSKTMRMDWRRGDDIDMQSSPDPMNPGK